MSAQQCTTADNATSTCHTQGQPSPQRRLSFFQPSSPHQKHQVQTNSMQPLKTSCANSRNNPIHQFHSLNMVHQSTMPVTSFQNSFNPNNSLKHQLARPLHHQLEMQQPMHQLQGCLKPLTLLQGWWNQGTCLASPETSSKAWTEEMSSTTGPEHTTINLHHSPKDIQRQLHSWHTKQMHTNSPNTMALLSHTTSLENRWNTKI